ncbi:glycosyltransferase [Lutispora thermophila]|uniref:Glycosyltransferase involved in cell wall bisynthesis n=1 Tax=Lutispora thermophila DSM 19022 TaxID=1122184 RepID=A0A1M6BX38_9FIRM|nr:glycosyltransferase [Lutispora thermophila]SHI53329.1 Glycosyltransferase involved in cell wall bisynthesis [Lutispora thermophila DSM 19022]
MNVLFLGGVFSKEMEEEILEKSKGTVHYAANKLQWNLMDGFIEIDKLKLEILSAPFIGAFPKDYIDIKYKGHKLIYRNEIECEYVSFNNIWGYRNLSRKKSLVRGIKEFANRRVNNKVIIVYSPHTPFLQAAVYAKKIDPSIHICLIVPDLPQYMNLNEKHSFIYDIFKRIDINIFNNNSKWIDSFVLLTEQMKDMLNVGKRPFIVIEGVVNIQNSIYNEMIDTYDVMSVVYTGTLSKKFGVVNLVKAFHKVKYENVCLKICGRGDSEDIIKEYASKDDRIKFLGQLSNEEAVKLQRKATVLVNPRQNNEEFTKYSFPSKNMEYLLTGRPVIAYKLDGIPNEYDNYFYYVADDSIESLTKTIEKVLALPEEERLKFGNKARDFVLREKNNYKACKKIIDMIQQSRSR